LFARTAADARLLASTCGNVSLRVAPERFLISATGCTLGTMSEQDVAAISLDDGRVVEGPHPSVETELHRRILSDRGDVGAVLHCQSFAATLLCCHPDPPLNLDLIPEIPAVVGSHAYVPFSLPGSNELAESVARAFRDEDVSVVQMRNHGQVVVGATWGEVLRRALFFELACRLVTHGSPVELIPEGLARILRERSRRC
jgi:ribulose-5-phosphate 4-epimerase/fuculose-1-phosphate aldolase